jgi:hypothetical protein
MNKPEDSDAKARFRSALEKKNQSARNPGKTSESENVKGLQGSKGKKTRIFRRKSG